MSDPDLSTFQARLKFLREKRGKTAQDCAAFLGITTGTYGRWEEFGFEKIREFMRKPVVQELSKHLGCSEEWLELGNGEAPT